MTVPEDEIIQEDHKLRIIAVVQYRFQAIEDFIMEALS